LAEEAPNQTRGFPPQLAIIAMLIKMGIASSLLFRRRHHKNFWDQTMPSGAQAAALSWSKGTQLAVLRSFGTSLS
jgi:hypothetical protein